MPTVLVIGASQGLGLYWVDYYKSQGYNVIATTRDPDKAVELKKLLTGGADTIVKMDVTVPSSVTDAMAELKEAPDITIYNSGVKGYTKSPDIRATVLNAELVAGDSSSREAGRNLAYEVNVHGFDRVMFALHGLLLKKPRATVVKVSTGVAPARKNRDGGYPFYRDSKGAGDILAREWDNDLGEAAIDIDSRPRVFSMIPRVVKAGMGENVKDAADPKTRIEEMANVIKSVIANGDTHGLWDCDGTKYEEYELPGYYMKKYHDKGDVLKFLMTGGFYKPSKNLVVTQGTQTEDSGLNNAVTTTENHKSSSSTI